jgi:nitrite reductase/ring-hydroxylating ferredoxin subunit
MRPFIDIDGKKFYFLDDLASFVQGKGKRFEINGADIAAFLFGETVVAFGNRCPHEGGNLCDGRMAGCKVACPRHGWTFDVQSGARDLDPEEKIPVYPTAVKDGIVWVCVEIKNAGV